jgi:hypothetical protein
VLPAPFTSESVMALPGCIVFIGPSPIFRYYCRMVRATLMLHRRREKDGGVAQWCGDALSRSLSSASCQCSGGCWGCCTWTCQLHWPREWQLVNAPYTELSTTGSNISGLRAFSHCSGGSYFFSCNIFCCRSSIHVCLRDFDASTVTALPKSNQK